MAASFPASLKSFTTKTDSVDDVLAAHVNDLQDEVVAIETALGAGFSHPQVQAVYTQTGAVSTGSTVIPYDDSIPQNTEGDEYMTLAITPKSATNVLLIEVTIHLASNATAVQSLIAALFQDSTAGALAAGILMKPGGSGNDLPQCLKFTHKMTSGTTSATTFKVRAGGDTTGTTTFNGAAGARKMGGVLVSSIVIKEIKA